MWRLTETQTHITFSACETATGPKRQQVLLCVVRSPRLATSGRCLHPWLTLVFTHTHTHAHTNVSRCQHTHECLSLSAPCRAVVYYKEHPRPGGAPRESELDSEVAALAGQSVPRLQLTEVRRRCVSAPRPKACRQLQTTTSLAERLYRDWTSTLGGGGPSHDLFGRIADTA